MLTITYAITAFGFALNLHYCGRLLTSVEINAPARPCTKLAVKWKCCKDKVVKVQLKDVHQAATTIFDAKNLVVAVPNVSFEYRFCFLPTQIEPLYSNKAPPDIVGSNIPVFLKNNSFRI